MNPSLRPGNDDFFSSLLEHKDVGELNAPEDLGVELRNVYFDITPARLITRCITEVEHEA